MANKNDKLIDKKIIKELVEILDDLKLSNLSYQKGDLSISVSKELSAVIPINNNVNKIIEKEEPVDYINDPRVITSPMVGTVYLQPEPGANKYVNTGDTVSTGQTILIIEAMKTMNQIDSTLQGKVSKVFVQNEEAVEFGQPLMLIE